MKTKIVKFNHQKNNSKPSFKKRMFEFLALGLISVPCVGISLAVIVNWTRGDKIIMVICTLLSILCNFIADPVEFKELIFTRYEEDDLYEDDEFADLWVEEVGAYYDPEEDRYFYYDEDEDKYFYYK